MSDTLDRPIIKHIPFYPGQWGILGSDSSLGIRTLPLGTVYYVHSENPNANNQNMGTDPNFPMSTLLAAYNRTISGQNDVVVLVGQATGYALAAPLVWANNYTHLIGECAELGGMGQRCRVTGSDVLDLLNLVTFQGSGCIVKNVQFYNGADAAQNSGAVVVTGSRCRFEHCWFNGINNAAVVGIRADVYSLKIDGGSAECYFESCAIGSDTLGRASTNAELWMLNKASKARFHKCLFLKFSTAATNFAANIDSALPIPIGLVIFDDCIFSNRGLATDVFNCPGAGELRIIIKDCISQGFTGWSNNLAVLWGAGAAPVNTFGLALNPSA